MRGSSSRPIRLSPLVAASSLQLRGFFVASRTITFCTARTDVSDPEDGTTYIIDGIPEGNHRQRMHKWRVNRKWTSYCPKSPQYLRGKHETIAFSPRPPYILGYCVGGVYGGAAVLRAGIDFCASNDVLWELFGRCQTDSTAKTSCKHTIGGSMFGRW